MEKVGKGEQQEKERGKDGDKGGEGMREGKKIKKCRNRSMEVVFCLEAL